MELIFEQLARIYKNDEHAMAFLLRPHPLLVMNRPCDLIARGQGIQVTEILNKAEAGICV